MQSFDLAPDLRAVVLVEGVSDAAAFDAFAARRGQSLDRVAVVPLGGATKVRATVDQLQGLDVAGLCDLGEERFFRRTLDTYFVCDADLEDELIRALGVDGVERVIDTLGDLAAFRTFQAQPFQRRRTVEQQLHRFIGTTSGRKERYARELAARTDRMPTPIAELLAWCG